MPRSVCRSSLLVLLGSLACAATPAAPVPVLAAAAVQNESPNRAGVAMGHLHYYVRDVEANRRFWVALGGRVLPSRQPQRDDGNLRGGRVIDLDRSAGTSESAREVAIGFRGVVVILTPGEPSGGTEGSVVNHVAFRVPSLSTVEAAGLTVQRVAGYPGVASVMSPEGERVELFENAATNLTFTFDPGYRDPIAERHNRPLTDPIAFHHVHLYVPEGSVAAAKAWYTRMFGGVPGTRGAYQAVDLPGVNLNFSAAPQQTARTEGRMLDHIAFEVRALKAFCTRLESLGIVFDLRYRQQDGIGTAVLTDPWGTRIELREGD